MLNNLIIGPCQHESLDHSKFLLEQIVRATDGKCKRLIFKASFDKANRTSITSKRGIGIEETLIDFSALKLCFPNVSFLTDVHEVSQIDYIEKEGHEIDVIQIPAFLCRQTDLIKRACETDKVVNIKKGQFLAPWDVGGILSKTEKAKDVWITERGTSFGYNTLVNDFTGMQYIIDNYPSLFVFDVTHSVQKPGGKGTSSGGNRDYVPRLANAAAGMGVENFFLEVHDDPDNAPSDGANALDVKNLKNVINKMNEIGEAAWRTYT
jgi:2-dehydro-3-deoxyphosphooctonate aldolase (KDO 8-P synthase)